jgi:AraC family transcriptional regulator
MPENRLVTLLDALLNGGGPETVYLSRYHYDRAIRRAVGEPPGRLRRRLLMEQAGYALTRGARVTDVAFASGYASAEGFTRAFTRAYGRPPRDFRAGGRRFRLDAPNGIHFHPPCGLLLPGLDEKDEIMDLANHLVEHDLWLTGELLDRAARLDDDTLDRPITVSVETVDDDLSIRSQLHRLVHNKEMWAAALGGEDTSTRLPDERPTIARLRERWDRAASAYREQVRRIQRRDDWGTTFIDARCEPPRTTTFAGAVSHVLVFSAVRRTVVLGALHSAGVTDLGSGDPERFHPSLAR